MPHMSRMRIAAATAVVCAVAVASPAHADTPAADAVWTEEQPAFTWNESGLWDTIGLGDEVWTAGFQGMVAVNWPPATWNEIVIVESRPVVQRHSGGRWKSFSLPGMNFGVMGELEASGAQNLWVLGRSYVWREARPYLARWDGSAWSQVAPPGNVRVGDLAVAPDATFAADVHSEDARLHTYAGGQWTTGPDTLKVAELASHPTGGAWLRGTDDGTPVVARWTSGSWQPIPLPTGSAVTRIFPLGEDYLLARVGNGYQRWDGSAWSPVGTSPAPSADDAVLSPSGTLWLSGGRTVASLEGSTWSQRTGPLPEYVYDFLIQGLASAGGKLWMAGYQYRNPVVASTTP